MAGVSCNIAAWIDASMKSSKQCLPGDGDVHHDAVADGSAGGEDGTSNDQHNGAGVFDKASGNEP